MANTAQLPYAKTANFLHGLIASDEVRIASSSPSGPSMNRPSEIAALSCGITGAQLC